MNIMLVEDEDPKRRHIAAFIQDNVEEYRLVTARSVRSAMDCLDEQIPDFLILDMSLPTFDIGGDETGGRPQGFGGLELIRTMELEGISCPVIVLTGYESFTKAGGQVSLDALNKELSEAHPGIFRGILHYNSAYGNWREGLSLFIDQMKKSMQ